MNSLSSHPRRLLTPVLAAALLAVPASDALAAAKPKLAIGAASPTASKSGAVSVGIKNASAFRVSGKVTAKSAGKTVGAKRWSAGAGKTKVVKVKLSGKARKKLASKRKLGLKLVVTAKGKGKSRTFRKSLTFKAYKRAVGGGGRPTGGAQGGSGAKPAGVNWVGRRGTSGAYDDFAFSLVGGKINMTKIPLMPVICAENGGSYRTATSLEPFFAKGPWTLGSDAESAKMQQLSGNTLAGSGKHTLTYRMSSVRSGNAITGQLKISFFNSVYDPFDNSITFINCFGTQSYEAVPAS